MINKTNINIIYLYILRVIMYIFPLITLPILLRNLGIENYGVISLMQAVANFFVMLINYGFNFTGSRDIARNSNNLERINEIFNGILCTKMLIAVTVTPLIIFIGLLVPNLRNNYYCYLLIFFVILNEVIFPVFFYQGMENMKMITLLNLISRMIGMVFIYFFVRKQDDLFLALLIINLSTLAGGILGLLYAIKRYNLKFKIVSFETVVFELKNGWNLFIAQGMTAMFSNSNILILGVILSPKIVGYYSVGEKIMRMAASFVAPFSNAIYPVIVKKFAESKIDAINFLRKYFIFGCVVFGLGSTILFVFSSMIILLFNGNQNIEMVNNLRIISFVPLSIFINNIYGTQIQLQISRERQFRNTILFCGILLPILTFIFSKINAIYGASIALLLSECLLTTLMVIDVEIVCRNGFFFYDKRKDLR